ncbi:MAG: hypothetical protein PW843_23305 [Azospirillaceae bacterium]|nr:hypothetical protein [Azospirillaceae bacterium]
MIAKHFLRAALLTSALTLGGAAVFAPVTPAHAAETKKVSPALGNALNAAKDAIKAKKYKDALDKLAEADKLSTNVSERDPEH